MTNRKEVAEKIRKCGVWLLDVSLKDKSVQAFAVLANAIGVEGNYSLIFNRLADLIDTTCKPVEADNNIVCSECGADLYDDDLYCPHCGARVVRDDL